MLFQVAGAIDKQNKCSYNINIATVGFISQRIHRGWFSFPLSAE
nr:MAG TPA: hypothetical protein [Caudoviricetes sp.]